MLKEFFSKLGKKDDSVLGVDISSSSVKVVQLRNKKGRAVLETYGEIALGPYGGVAVGHATSLPPDKVADALADLLKEAKTTTLNAGVAIPYSSSLISLIEMPAVGEKKLKEMIPIEARKFIPVPISEVLLDWTIIPEHAHEDDGGETEGKEQKGYKKVDVLVVAIHKDTIERFQNIVDKVGLEASFLEIEVFSTLRAILHGEAEPVLVLDVGADTTKVFVIERRVLQETHIINSGSQNITTSISKSLSLDMKKAEQLKREVGVSGVGQDEAVLKASSVVLDSLLSDAKRVMLGYQRKHNVSVSKVILTGGGSILKGLVEKASQALEMEAELAHPFSKVETPAFLEDVLREAGPEFAVAIGVALRKLDELN